MGEVYAAFDRDLGEEVALKILRPAFQAESARLLQEVLAARRVTHPNVCRIFDIGRDGQLAFFTMELLPGVTLAEHLQPGALPRGEFETLYRQLASALRAAHAAGVLHRDLKPANVMRVSADRFVITDFGLAHRLENGRSTASGPLAGTLGYLAPEVIAGRPHTAAADIYSFGILLHQAATRRMPFDEKPLAAILDSDARRPSGLDASLAAFVDQCLQLDPSRRPRELPERLPSPARVDRRWWLAGATAVGAGAAGVTLFPSVVRVWERTPIFPAVDTVLLTPIRNTTGQARFDGVTALLAGQLGQSPRFELMSARRRGEHLARMTKPADTPLDEPVARQIALRQGRTAIVYGQVSKILSDFWLDVKIEQPDGRPDHVPYAAEQRFRAASADDLLERIRGAAQWLREVAGEGAEDRSRYNRAPAELTTPSWDALALFEQAAERRQKEPEAAIALLREAVRLDPEFASAHRALADVLVAQRQYGEGYATWFQAVETGRRRQLNSRERFRLEAAYYDDVDDLKSAEAVNRLWIAAYPKDYLPHFYLGNVLLRGFRLPEGLEQMSMAVRLQRTLASVAHLARHLIIAGRFKEAKREIDSLGGMGYPADVRSLTGTWLAVQGDIEGALREHLAGTSNGEQLEAAYAMTELGRAEEAERYLMKLSSEDESKSRFPQQGEKLGVAGYLAFVSGSRLRAQERLRQAVRLTGPLHERVTIALARAGLLREAMDALAETDRTNATGSRFKRLRLRFRGEIRLAQGDIENALASFRESDSLATLWRLNDSLPRALAQTGRTNDAAIADRTLRERLPLMRIYSEALLPGYAADIAQKASEPQL